MAFEKCPRCELNYILDGGNLCTVCRKEVCGEDIVEEMPEMCSECGENPAVPSGELCISCLKNATRHSASKSTDDDEVVPDDQSLEIDSMSDMEEIELDPPDEGMDDEVFDDGDDEDEFEDDDDAIEVPLIDDEDDYLPEDDYGDDDPRNR